VKENIMVQKKNTSPDDDKSEPDEATAAAEPADDAPTPTQAEMDEVRKNLHRTATYATREAKAD
jgi:hypothetical protein